MNRVCLTGLLTLSIALSAGASSAVAQATQTPAKPFEPTVGQAGKDVVWVPTPQALVEKMLDIAKLTPQDFLMDLGSGDGRTVITAARRGARALGIEYNPDMAKHAQRNIERAGVAGKAKVVQGDIFASDFTQATVVTMYLLPGLNMKLRPQILSMRAGTRVVSHSFNMEDWDADEISSLDGRRAYLWIVPANVMGNWTLEAGGERTEIALEQRFQKVDGTVALGPVQAGLREARLRGFHIAFAYVDNNGVRRDFSGRVSGNRMEGSFRAESGAEGRWSATRK